MGVGHEVAHVVVQLRRQSVVEDRIAKAWDSHPISPTGRADSMELSARRNKVTVPVFATDGFHHGRDQMIRQGLRARTLLALAYCVDSRGGGAANCRTDSDDN
jgi:hypothetical protein